MVSHGGSSGYAGYARIIYRSATAARRALRALHVTDPKATCVLPAPVTVKKGRNTTAFCARPVAPDWAVNCHHGAKQGTVPASGDGEGVAAWLDGESVVVVFSRPTAGTTHCSEAELREDLEHVPPQPIVPR